MSFLGIKSLKLFSTKKFLRLDNRVKISVKPCSVPMPHPLVSLMFVIQFTKKKFI